MAPVIDVTTLDTLGLWVLGFNRELCPVLWNDVAAQESGYSAQQILTGSALWGQLFPEELRARAEAILAGVAGRHEQDVTHRLANGERRTVSWRASLWPDVAPGPGLLFIGHDVTTQRQKLEQARDEASRYGEAVLVSGAGHPHSSDPGSLMARLLPLVVYLVAVGGWVAYCAVHRFHIGRMLLPRVQAVVLSLTFVVAVSLVGAWVLLALRLLRRLSARLRGSVLPRATLDRRRVYVPLLMLLVLAAGLAHYGLHIEPRSLRVRELRLGAPSPDAPRIAVISDLHIDRWRPPFTELAATVNRTRPDLILLLGDTLNRAAALPALHRCLRAMRAPSGKLAVRGNWDVWYWRDLPLLQGTGFHWLDGTTSRSIRGTRVQLVGLPYRDGDHGRRGERLLARLPRGGWRLFLYHTPDMALQVPSADLYLAGHTHGGQVALPLFGALVTLSRHGKRFERGENHVGRMTIYTNPGIGVEPMLPLRLGVPPEVTLIRLGRPPGDQG